MRPLEADQYQAITPFTSASLDAAYQSQAGPCQEGQIQQGDPRQGRAR